jgi:ABC-type glycerol-3-phosphate transport system substrate-binding protein
MSNRKLTRRRFVQQGSLAAGATLAAPYVHGATAGGRLHVGFWDHWVPTANDPMSKLCQQWAAKEKVDLAIDYITSNGNKIIMTIAAEAQAKSGHDMLSMNTWYCAGQAKNLEPVDDVMKALISSEGKVAQAAEYLGKQDGHWIGVPGTWGNATFPCVARIDLMKQHTGMDLQKMYPADGSMDKAAHEAWTWEAFLNAAEKCHKAGVAFGKPMSDFSDSVNWAGTVFAAYGAELVDKNGNVTVKSDATKQVVEWFKRLVPFLPADVWSWDNAGNNKWFVSGKGALIMNPPSAWAVAKRDAPKIAEQTWCFPPPKGPKGRFIAGQNYFYAIWKFSKNKSAAKSLAHFLSERKQAESLIEASQGFDLPSFEKQMDFKVWREQGPPPGTIAHYPSGPDTTVWISGAPAPTRIGVQLFAQATMTKMIAQAVLNGKSTAQVMDWAAGELEGFMR